MTNTVLDPGSFPHQIEIPVGEVYLASSEADFEGYFYIARGCLGSPESWEDDDDIRIDWYAPIRVRVNVEPLQLALDHITNLPHTWDQSSWFVDFADASKPLVAESPVLECGTVACLAGTIALQTGAAPHVDSFGHRSWSLVVVPSGFSEENQQIEVDKFALHVLFPDLQPNTSEFFEVNDMLHILWHGGNLLSDLWSLGRVLTAGRLRVPDASVIYAAQQVADEYWS